MKRRASDQVKQQAASYREAGKSVPWIARKMGWSIGTVYHWCLALGAETPAPPGPPGPRRTTPVCRNGRTIHPFSPADDRLLQDWEKDDLTFTEMAGRLTALDPSRPRMQNSVRSRLMILARHEAREEARQEARSARGSQGSCPGVAAW